VAIESAKQRDAQEIDGEQRRRLRQLPQHQQRAGDDRAHRLERDGQYRLAVARAVDGGDEKAEEHGVERGARDVEAAPRARDARQGAGRHQRHQSDRHVDGKEPGPRGDRQDPRGHRGAERGRHGDDDGIDADAASQHRARISEADQGAVDAEHGRGADALHDAGEREHEQRVRERAAQRGGRKAGEPRPIQPPIADDLAQRRERQQQNGDGELIGVDHPDRARRACMQIPGDGRQRHIGDGAVQNGHGDGKADGQNGPIALRQRQTVGELGRWAPDGRGPNGARLLRHLSSVAWLAACGHAFPLPVTTPGVAATLRPSAE
jgi:hypothetical protein